MIARFAGPYRFLSNFYPVVISMDGEFYPSVEHAYQAAKTLDTNARVIIALAPTAGAAKRAGRRVELRPNWESEKIGIMLGLLKKKFKDPDLHRRLVETGDHELVEGNTWNDTFWGVCNGTGQNWLGRLLMGVRAQAKEGRL